MSTPMVNRAAIEGGPTPMRWRFLALSLILALSSLLLITSGSRGVMAVEDLPESAPSHSASVDPLRSYLVRLAEPNVIVAQLVLADQVSSEIRERNRLLIEAELEELAASGEAGAFAYDEVMGAFKAELTDAARDALASSPFVVAIEPWSDVFWREGAAWQSGDAAQTLPPPDFGGQEVSSIAFVQVHSPFVWGRTSVGGLAVTITLESSAGITKGIPIQLNNPAPNNYVKIDRAQLYWETLFVDPDTGALALILPGDRVHIVTSGLDPSIGQQRVDDRRIVVDDVRVWTSYERDTVSGTGPPNSSVIATVGTGLSPSISQYLTPGSSVKYAELTAGADGSFVATAFKTSASEPYRTVDLQQGSNGFVRVRHSDGNEVYSVHGQNTFVLENSDLIHGWAFQFPTPPLGLDLGVALPVTSRYPTVVATLTSPTGQLKGTVSKLVRANPYDLSFPAGMISGGDVVEVTINTAAGQRIATSPLTAVIDLESSQVSGSGPPNTQLTVGAGRINGYITKLSTFTYLQNRVTTDGAGAYSSGRFVCGSSNSFNFQPGSFGYVGYEDARGSFVYMSFAAPVNQVMVDFPYIEGWVANGAVPPSVTIRDSGGNLKQQANIPVEYLWMTAQKLFVNTFYYYFTSDFVVPSDTVTLVSGGSTSIIPVDRFTAFANMDTESVVGEAPAGARVRVVPDDRMSYREVVAGSSGTYSAGNPFRSISYDCRETDATNYVEMGDSGRAYTKHSDGNEVFMAFGRSMHVNLNENYVELYSSTLRDLDWIDMPLRPTVVATLVSRDGDVTQVTAASEYGRPGKTKIYFVDEAAHRVLIRAGDSITATFREGPPNGPTREVVVAMNAMALVTGSPDIDTNTLAGIGPRGWNGQAILSSLPPPTSRRAQIPPGAYTAYQPLRFTNSSNATIPLQRGYNGTVSFSDLTGHRVWAAWSVTANQVKITGWLRPGNTQVCGKAPPGNPVTIHDVTSETIDIVIGSTTSDAQGNFCASVPPLFLGQVLIAESAGTLSQPVVVGLIFDIYLPEILNGS